MSNPKVRCDKCCGTGFRHLPKKLKASFAIAEKLSQTGSFLVSDFQKAHNNGSKVVKLDTAHHRIGRLVKLGLLKRDGKVNPARYLAEKLIEVKAY